MREAAMQRRIKAYYEFQNEIGKGKFSKVFKAINIKTKLEVAVKKVKKSDLLQTEKDLIRQEIAVLQLLNHPNIVKLYEIFDT